MEKKYSHSESWLSDDKSTFLAKTFWDLKVKVKIENLN